MVEAIIATMLANAIDVLVCDPFAETFEGDENSNSELKWAAALWREIARRTNAAVLLVHHTKKYGAEPGSPDASRGGSSLTGVARIVSTLFPMTNREAEAMGIEPSKRANYLRYDDAKANLTLVTFAARWFEKKTITLDNAGDDEPADEVGVLSPWKPPSIWDRLTQPIIDKIIDAIAVGRLNQHGKPIGETFGLSTRGKSNARWVGHVIKSNVEATDAEAETAIKAWLKTGLIEEVPCRVNRKEGGKGVRVRGRDLPDEAATDGQTRMKLVAADDED
jgi:hypothetical protein